MKNLTKLLLQTAVPILVCIFIGLSPERSFGVIVDTTPEWTEEMQRKAEAGDKESEWLLGRAYELGSGIDSDGALAEQWLIKAGAKTEIGRMYKYGDVVDQNYSTALKWFNEASAEGDAKAKIQLGIMYGGGQGVPRDMAAAKRWFLDAADTGDGEIRYEIAMRFKNGDIVKKDCKEAMKWLFDAVEHNYPAGLLSLSEAYQYGDCVEKDLKEAYFWRAAWFVGKGHDLPDTPFGKNLSETERAALQRRVDVWLKSHPGTIE